MAAIEQRLARGQQVKIVKVDTADELDEPVKAIYARVVGKTGTYVGRADTQGFHAVKIDGSQMYFVDGELEAAETS